MMGNEKALLDRLKRPLKDLRISVTDQCNFRCTYCMPKEIFDKDYPFLEKTELLSFDEIIKVAERFVASGVTKLRITGGEPLMRKDLPDLIGKLNQLKGLEDLALTTNGVLLPRVAHELKKAGMDRVTVSLDSLNSDLFGRINGRGIGVKPVLEGMKAAHEAGLQVKVNMMVRKGVNEQEILPMAKYFKKTPYILRFIEFMDVGTTNGWNMKEVVTKEEILKTVQSELPLQHVPENYYGEVASRYQFADGENEIGIISSISDSFCSSCTRARLSADGKVYTCLFASNGTDIKTPLREGATDQELDTLISRIWENRTDRYSDERREGAATRKKIEMSYIGG
ncbi:cyclic pyranopterin phosphate synthase [Fictibacillus solisalsi]|uniref:GTP 3',8-cyclase n=1 Tax=Fictibacillus solisalsi TaxID=459525 RepID=A0A1G9WAW0_9BACL|nr:GTP 3',8-cyclase MoaA [Fictibacillus solisalsi]SDM81135.1 cyclic pyranopterin phosphate synthase [Fictibacillus solisalsi]